MKFRWNVWHRFFRTGRSLRRTVVWETPNDSIVANVAADQEYNQKFGVIYVDIRQFREFEDRYGSPTAQSVLHSLRQALDEVVPQVVKDGRVSAKQNLWGDDFFIYLALPGEETVLSLVRFSQEIRERLEARLLKIPAIRAHGGLSLHVGAVLVEDDSGQGSINSRLYQAAKQAQAVAKEQLSPQDLADMTEFRKILSGDGLHSVYQPVVKLRNGAVFGWEALMRGPADSRFASPGALIDFAVSHAHSWALERAARTQAFHGLGQLPPGAKLFLNVNPDSLMDPEFTAGQTQKLVQAHGLHPGDVIIEITERSSMKDFSSFRWMIQHYRDQGFLIAIDDVGEGYSGLRSVAELRPDFIKIDLSLILGCNSDPVKQALIEALVTVAGKTGSKVIAEGIETREDLRTVLRLGVDYGQGYLLARPAAPKPDLVPGVVRMLSTMDSPVYLGGSASLRIGTLILPSRTVLPTMLVRDVSTQFGGMVPFEGVVVVDQGSPVGLVTYHRLFQRLGARYGFPLYHDRTITHVMDSSPIIVEQSTSVETVARLAGLRGPEQRYDPIIVTDHGGYVGVVPVHQLLNVISDVQFNAARQANPLTGLPGNSLIEDTLRDRLAGQQPFAAMYIDLDNFKNYNDNYGFVQGDRVLSFTAKLLRRAMLRHGNSMDFLGHIGGDDFLLVTTPDRVEALGFYMVRLFERIVPRFFTKADYLIGFDRGDLPTTVSLSGLSIAVAEWETGKISPRDLAECVAALKREAKRAGGSRLVRAKLTLPTPSSLLGS